MSHHKLISQISAFSDPHESPGYLLWRVSMRWRNAIERALKPLGLTHPQFVLLAVTQWLADHEGDLSQRSIASMAGLDVNTTSQVLRGLQAKGLIARAQVRDRRSKQPHLTAAGAAMLRAAMPAVEAADTQFFATLTPEQRIEWSHGTAMLIAGT